jgi:toxin ParE1/3/4
VEIGSWIAADRPGAAAKLVGDLFAAVERLAIFPESGRAVPEFERDDLREVIFRSYRIIYRYATDRLEVLTVRHSLQELDPHDFGNETVG